MCFQFARKKSAGECAKYGSRQIGPRQIRPWQIGPLVDLVANWATHFWGPSLPFFGYRGSICRTIFFQGPNLPRHDLPGPNLLQQQQKITRGPICQGLICLEPLNATVLTLVIKILIRQEEEISNCDCTTSQRPREGGFPPEVGERCNITKAPFVCEVSEDTNAENARSGRGVEVSSPCTPPSSPGMVRSRWQGENCQIKRFQCQFEQVDVAQGTDTKFTNNASSPRPAVSQV